MRDGKCLIFGAATPCFIPEIPEKRDDLLIIAADGGYDSLKKANIKPDILVGDFDSLEGNLPEGIGIFRHPVKKDLTDTALAVCLGEERGYTEFELYGCLGGERFDHGIATLQLMTAIAEKKEKIKAFFPSGSGKITEVTAISGVGKLSFPETSEGVFSVFCAKGFASGVFIKNAVYPLDDEILLPSNPIGVSNEFIPGKSAEISVKEGTLWIIK